MAPLLCSVLCLAAVTACTSDGAGDATTEETTPGPPIAAATVPPERQTPFCEAMNDLNSRLISDPPEDVEAEIIEVYRDILPDVPDEISDDFIAVLTAMETGQPMPTTPPPTTSSSDTDTSESTTSEGSSLETTSGEEGFDAELFELSTPAERINGYVAFVCRDTANNPGPPATEPFEVG